MSGEAPALPTASADTVTFLWDLDKTYLRTELESFRKMVRIPFEAGRDKQHLPGVPELIQGLRRHAEQKGKKPSIFFLSASPPQIGAAIRDKLAIDGVVYDGITFKDQLGDIVHGRWKSLREQVGYKLGELLVARCAGPVAAREFLFGDDWESDPLIYSLYADILGARIDSDTLQRVLVAVRVRKAAIERILAHGEILSGTAPDAVERIYINLERRTPPARFRAYGARVSPTFNTLQAAASLYHLRRLGLDDVMGVARAVLLGPTHGGYRLRNSIDDLTRRGHLPLAVRDRLVHRLARDGLARLSPDESKLRARLRAALSRFRRAHPLRAALEGADYERLLSQWEAS